MKKDEPVRWSNCRRGNGRCALVCVSAVGELVAYPRPSESIKDQESLDAFTLREGLCKDTFFFCFFCFFLNPSERDAVPGL